MAARSIEYSSFIVEHKLGRGDVRVFHLWGDVSLQWTEADWIKEWIVMSRVGFYLYVHLRSWTCDLISRCTIPHRRVWISYLYSYTRSFCGTFTVDPTDGKHWNRSINSRQLIGKIYDCRSQATSEVTFVRQIVGCERSVKPWTWELLSNFGGAVVCTMESQGMRNSHRAMIQ